MCNPRCKFIMENETLKRHISTCKKLASKLAKSKAKLELLNCSVDVNLFSSLRVHVGKVYNENGLEEKKSLILKACQKELLELSRREAIANLECDRENLKHFFDSDAIQALSYENYNILTSICSKYEASLILKLSQKHERKIAFFENSNACEECSPKSPIKPEKKRKHKAKKKVWRRKRQKIKRELASNEKKQKQLIELEKIKSSNLVLNLSSQEIPDEMYFYLALGSTFVPCNVYHKHDFVFDAKNFCRKLAWSFFHSENGAQCIDKNTTRRDGPDENIDAEEESQIVGWNTSAKLRIKGRSYPPFTSKFCDQVTKKIVSDVEGITLSDRKWKNLSLVERRGLKLCQKAVRDRILYFTKADKGGAMLVLDASDVDDIIVSVLTDEDKFRKIKEGDPRAKIKSDIKKRITSFEEQRLLSRNDSFLITGVTEKGGMSHSPSFCVRKTHTYPLFKVHKLSEKMILDKVIPPVRMVTSGVGGPTYRLGMFLDDLLKPVVEKYCKHEIVKDTTSFLASLLKLEEDGSLNSCSLIGTLDVDALYPSIKTEFVQEAIKHALCTCTNLDSKQINMIIELVNFSIKNAVVHYRGSWFAPTSGIPTGGSESGCIANIYVKWCLDVKILPSPDVCKYNKMDKRKRFLDDIWFLWRGSARVFSMFLNVFNLIGCQYGITLKGEVNDMVNFLDVTTMLTGNQIRTCLFVKPTDAKRYLHRKSDHSLHTFKSTPYSQLRRVVIICSDPDDRDHFMRMMLSKFEDSGYVREELLIAKEKALQIDRLSVLQNLVNNFEPSKRVGDTLTFVINHDRKGSSQIRHLMKNNQEMINYLFGKEIKVIVAERRSPNTASLLFAKAGFSRELAVVGDTQECGSRLCMTCDVMNIESCVVIHGLTVKMDYSLNCGSESVIYLYLCNLCENPCHDGFYFGQTINCLRERANGHRSSFDEHSYKKSALAYHIWDMHREHFYSKLLNFRGGLVKQTLPEGLDRAEDFFVVATKADTMGLNRYKVCA